MTRQRMIYIAGAGHSGSTLLEMFVSGAAGHVGLGEIFQLVDLRNPTLTDPGDHRCSCGQPVESCAFWGRVLPRLRELPAADENARYALLGTAFAESFGSDAVLIDSSKVPEGLERAVQSGAFDIKVLHLARDVRPWLLSMQKSYHRNGVGTLGANVRRDGLFKGMARYALRNPLADARKWRRINTEVERVVARHGLPSLAVSYERLCLDSAAVHKEIEGFVGAAITPYGDTQSRTNNHSIFGNRMRFEPEKLAAIRYDDSWQNDTGWKLAYALSPGVQRMNARLTQHGGAA